MTRRRVEPNRPSKTSACLCIFRTVLSSHADRDLNCFFRADFFCNEQDEFVLEVKRLMLGTAKRGLIATEEACALFDRIDADKSGTIDYRETGT